MDGDPAAAMRYTESRLSPYGWLMIEEMAKNTYDTKDNFDSTQQEAVYLPTLFANAICNGATEGIAVGMASKMVPHNLTEVYNALIEGIDILIAEQPITTEFLLQHMQGPDFPLGGQVIGQKGIRDYFETGRGRLIIRSKYRIEEQKNGTEIIVTEIPYKTNKQRLVERINDLTETHLKEIKTAIDETDRDGLQITIQLRKGVNTQTVIQKLCKYTDFEIAYSVNNNLLFEGQPFTKGMAHLLTQFIQHGRQVVYRRMVHDLTKMMERADYLRMILWAIDNSDLVIPIIKESESTDDVFEALKQVDATVTSEQAQIVGSIRLRQLSTGNHQKFSEEHQQLLIKIETYQMVLKDKALLLEELKKDFIRIRDKYGDARRTEILLSEKDEVTLEDLLDEEALVMTYTTDHLIKTCSEKEFRATNRGAKGVSSGINQEESLKYMLSVSNKETLMFFTSKGRCHTLKVHMLPKMARTAKGRSIYNFLTLEEDEMILNVINVDTRHQHYQNQTLIFVTRQGVIKKLDIDKLSTVRSVTKVITFKEDDRLISANLADTSQEFVICTASGLANRFNLADVRASGRSAAGVTGIKFKVPNDYVVDAVPVQAGHKMLTVTEWGYGKLSDFTALRKCRRGSKGVVCQKTADAGQLVAMLSLEEEPVGKTNEILMATQNGQLIRIDANQIRACGRQAKGVKLANLQEQDIIVAVSLKQSEVKSFDDNESVD